MKNHNLLVGIFTTAAIALFAAALFLIGNGHKAFRRHVVFYTNFRNVDGLPKGAKKSATISQVYFLTPFINSS